MSKRRKELRKRKRQQDQPQAEVRKPEVSPEPVESDGAEEPAVSVLDDSQVVAPRRAPEKPKTSPSKRAAKNATPARVGEDTWSRRNRDNILLGLLVIYVILLGLGTVGELFEVEWILNMPLFR